MTTGYGHDRSKYDFKFQNFAGLFLYKVVDLGEPNATETQPHWREEKDF